MKTLILLFIFTLPTMAKDPSDAQTTKTQDVRQNVLKDFGKQPNHEQRQRILEVVSSITKTLRSNEALKAQIKNYYHLLSVKKSGPSVWSSLDTIAGTPVSPDTPSWLLKQKLDDGINNLEKSIATIINESLDPYIIKNVNDINLNEEIIISSAITYNEQTLPTHLVRVVLPIEHNDLLKTNLVFSPSPKVSTSVLVTFSSDEYEVDVATKEVRDHLIEHEVKQRLSSLD